MPCSDVPADRRATYGHIVVDIRPQKEEVECTRLAVGGNLIDCPGNVSAKTADLTTTKLLFNSVLSMPNAHFMGIDIKNFCLGTPTKRYECMFLPIEIIPDEIIACCNLLPLVHNGKVCMEICRGMCGLPQAGIIAQELLTERLAQHGCRPCQHTHGSWKHDTRPITFTLVVDDFGVKHVNKTDAQHLINAAGSFCPISMDWKGDLHCGVKLNWDCTNRTVELSMPNYVQAAFHEFQHATPNRPQHAPSHWTAPEHGKSMQCTKHDNAPPMTPAEKKTLQRVVGKFLFHARAFDPTMLHELNRLASAQTIGTQGTAKELTHFLNCCATHPNAAIRCQASDMILHIHSDATYLAEPQSRSRAGGHCFSSDEPSAKPPKHNGPGHALVKIIKSVMSSAAEAEAGALFCNCKDTIPMRMALEEMGHQQPPTPLQVDNSTAAAIANTTCKQVRTKAMDVRFCWMQDRVNQKQFHVCWAPGDQNLADHCAKHHPIKHHIAMRPLILNKSANAAFFTALRECADSWRQSHKTGKSQQPPTVKLPLWLATLLQNPVTEQ